LKVDTMTLLELREFLGDMSNEPSAFGALSLELIAAKALQEGDIELARSEYNLLRVSDNVPAGAQQRIRNALATLPPPPPAPVVEESVEGDAVVESEGSTPSPSETEIDTDAGGEPDEESTNEG